MVHTPPAGEPGYDTARPWLVQAERARYRTALSMIDEITSTAVECPCCLVVARVAAAALARPAARASYWRYCEV